MPVRRASFVSVVFAAALVPIAVLSACKSDTPPEPVQAETTRSAPITSAPAIRPRPSASFRPPAPMRRPVVGRPAASVKPSEDDPLKGKWTLAEATKDIKGKGTLIADIEVEIPKEEKGAGTKTLSCALFEDRSPLTVANFVGLGTGKRPWKSPAGKWEKKPAYDGTIFHRIVKGFMIQGGDAAGSGAGEPGYVVPDEVWDGAYHDRPGLLCMANRGPDTNGAQFFITDGAAAHLDNRYTIFGECTPVDAIHAIANVDVKGERPAHPPVIKKITFRRGTSPVPLSSASAAASASGAPSAAPPPGAPPAPPAH
jgi:peptidyl-prolyl cis-trans isomerase A (cyclophilin A)